MKKDDLQDTDIADLFAAPQAFDDAEVFEARVMRRLKFKYLFRQGLVVLAGSVGGLYALAQFVRLPDWTTGNTAVSVPGANAGSGTFVAGAELVDQLRQDLSTVTERSMHYLLLMQTPMFFWLSFSLCLAFLGLYYAYSQEETL